MGIPKFFRYIAQRWPLSSQLVNGNVIPEFDNLYLDMNSIIHMSTHANADVVGHLNEDEVFLAVTNYIEHLFSVIQPKDYFVLAIDGVAPRAKMNQQRSRRFRSAQDAETQRRKAAERGEELDEDPFDSNCITPGTEFMAHLTTHLKYFIARKITEDAKWQTCKIILSGHEVPGEGEHKIMEFIRNLRAQPDYKVNTRHCLYGLDADLIMLGLSTHEPHFSLLREEVTFSRKVQFQSKELSEQRFNLLHLSLVREYIQLELTTGKFKHKPDFERLLDDLILILFVIGNDFLPELPMLLVHDGAIPVIFDTYKSYLYSSDNAYITHNGNIDFQALRGWLEYLKSYQVRKFEQQCALDNWFSSEMEKVTTQSGEREDEIVLSASQRDVFEDIKKFMRKCISKQDHESTLKVDVEPKFVGLVAAQAGFTYNDNVLRYVGGDHAEKEETEENEENPTKTVPQNPDEVDSKTGLRVLRIYSVAKVHEERNMEDYGQKFTDWKNRYYQHKFKDTYDSEVVRHASNRYLEGLQWVLSYYYQSCPSWSWYYDNHYSTMTTELISAIDAGFKPHFDLGTPFKPFEQLMSVLPDRSAALVPPSLRHLMLEETSPLSSFYPHSFEVDKNGKRADWEAVVLIPFIDEKLMLKYVAPIEENELTDDEKMRNSRGTNLEFEYNPNGSHFYKSPSRLQPDLHACTCVSHVLKFANHSFRYGLIEGTSLGKSALAGFPSLYTLPFTWELKSDFGVKVFEMPSRADSVIIDLKPAQERIKSGQTVYINWPFLMEAKVATIKAAEPNAKWFRHVQKQMGDYKRAGVDLGTPEAYVGVKELEGLVRNPDGSYEKEFGDNLVFVPVETVVTRVENEDPRFIEKGATSLLEEFPVDSHALLLLQKFYGFPVTVKENDNKSLDVEVTCPRQRDPVGDASTRVVVESARDSRWFTTEQTAKIVNLDIRTLLNLTSRIMCESEDGKKLNFGIRLRLPIDNLMAKGYACTDHMNRWFFSQRAIDLIKLFLQKFGQQLRKVANTKSKAVIDKHTTTEYKEFLTKHFANPAYIPVSNNELAPNAISKIEKVVLNAEPVHLERVLIKGLERNALLAPNTAHHQLRSQSFNLGDRVIFALDHGKVPLFMRGVVVGVLGANYANTTLNVVWDFEFSAGSNLDGTLSTNRGLNVPASSVLNLTQPQLRFRTGAAPKVTRISAKVDMKNTLTEKLIQKEQTKSHFKPAPAPLGTAWRGHEAPTPVTVPAPANIPVAAAPAPAPAPAAAPAAAPAPAVPVAPAAASTAPAAESSAPAEKSSSTPGVKSSGHKNHKHQAHGGPKGHHTHDKKPHHEKKPHHNKPHGNKPHEKTVEKPQTKKEESLPNVQPTDSQKPKPLDTVTALGNLSLQGRRKNANEHAQKLLAAINRPAPPA